MRVRVDVPGRKPVLVRLQHGETESHQAARELAVKRASKEIGYKLPASTTTCVIAEGGRARWPHEGHA
jgi:hypothetical protein